MKKVLWIMMALMSPVLLYGATYTWDGSGDGTTWDTTSQNWSPAGAAWTSPAHFAELGSSNVTLGDQVRMTGFDGSGTLDLGANSLRLGGSGVTSTFSGTLNGTGQFVWDSSSIVDLSGTNNATGQSVLRNNGTLRLSSADAWQAGTKAKIEPGTGSFTIELAAADEDFDSNLFLNASLGTARFAAVGAERNMTYDSGSGNFVWGSNGRKMGVLGLGNANSTHTLTWTDNINLNGANRTVHVLNGSAAIGGNISGVISGTGAGLTKTGTGTLELSAANTYTGMTTVAEGELILSGSLAGDATVASNAVLEIGTAQLSVLGDLILTNGAQVNLDFTGAATVSRISFDGGATYITSGTFDSSDAHFAGSGELLIIALPANALIWDGTSNSGDGSTWNTTYANWDTTDTTPWDTAAYFGVLGSANVTLGATVKLTGFNGSGTLDLGANGLRLGGNGVTSTFSGTLNGTGNVLWDGGATVDLSGTNNNTGLWVLRNNGTLRLSSADAWKAGSKAKIELSTGTSNNKFTVELAAANEVFDRTLLGITTSDPAYLDTTVSFAAIGADRNIAYNGAGDRLNWGRSGERIGTLGLGNANSTHALNWTSDINLYGTNRTVDVENGSVAVDAEISGAIESLAWEVAGGFGLTKTGAGTLKLSATNTYTGMTTVEEGKLLLTGSLAGDATIASNAVLEAGQGTIDGALTLADGAIIDYSEANGGGITLNGLLTQAGGFTLNLTDEIFTTTFDLFDGSGNFADLDLSAATINDVYGLNAGKTLTINGQTVQLGIPEGALENFDIAISGGDVVLTWDGLSTLTYAVESTPTLSIPDWNDVTNNIPGVDGTVSVTTGVSSVTEFFRAYVE